MFPSRWWSLCTSVTGKLSKVVPRSNLTMTFEIHPSCKHRCRGKFRLTLKPDSPSGQVCDAYVSAKDGSWWAIEEVLDEDHFFCHRIKTEEYHSKAKVGLHRGQRLPWHLVGVKMWVCQVLPLQELQLTCSLLRFTGFDEDNTTILAREDIRGKLMQCEQFMCEWLPTWFEESKIDYWRSPTDFNHTWTCYAILWLAIKVLSSKLILRQHRRTKLQKQ